MKPLPIPQRVECWCSIDQFYYRSNQIIVQGVFASDVGRKGGGYSRKEARGNRLHHILGLTPTPAPECHRTGSFWRGAMKPTLTDPLAPIANQSERFLYHQRWNVLRRNHWRVGGNSVGWSHDTIFRQVTRDICNVMYRHMMKSSKKDLYFKSWWHDRKY